MDILWQVAEQTLTLTSWPSLGTTTFVAFAAFRELSEASILKFEV
jgi:hypothetical protein